jgi:hypothetical protein
MIPDFVESELSIIQKSDLKYLFSNFSGAYEKLRENPTLETALNANLLSLKIIDYFYELDLKNKECYFEYAEKYKKLVNLCLKKFQEMTPDLDEQVRHIDLYSEQMRGRINLVERIYPRKREIKQ